MTFVAFLYGFASAFVAIVAAVIFGFSRVRLVTAQKLRAIESTFDTVHRPAADTAAKLDPIKIASKVKLSRFDHGFMAGVPKNCRLVLLASTITVYELPAADGSMTGSSAVATVDQPNTAAANNASGPLPAGGGSGSGAAFSGESPGLARAAAARGAVSHLTQPGERLLGKIHIGSVVPILHQHTLPTNNPKVAASLDPSMLGEVLLLKCRPDSATQLLFLPQSGGGDTVAATAASALPSTAMSCTDDLPQLWTSIAIKFSTKRDMERWANALAVTPETDAWRSFVKRLPSLDVLNLFIARIVFENNKMATGGDSGALSRLIHAKIEKKLRIVSKNLPKPISGFITVQKVRLGDNLPFLSEVSYMSYATSGEMAFDFNLDYRGGFTVTLLATLSVRSVQIPQLILVVRLVELKGRMHVSIGAPPSSQMWIGFHAPPTMSIDFKQEVATHEGVLSAVVALIPDLSEFVSNYVKVSLFEEMVLPKMENLSIPNVESGDDDSDDDGDRQQKHPRKHAKQSSSGSNGDASSLDLPTNPTQAKGTPQKVPPLSAAAAASGVAAASAHAVSPTPGMESYRRPQQQPQHQPVANTLPQRQPTTIDTDGGFVLVDGGGGSLTPQPLSAAAGGYSDPMAMSTDRRRLLGGGVSLRQQSHGRTLSGGSGDPLAASGSLLVNPAGQAPQQNRSPSMRQRALSPTPPSPKQHGSQQASATAAAVAAVGAAALGGASSSSSSQLPDAVRQKSDNVKAVLAQKAAELRRAMADGGGVGFGGAAQTPPVEQPPLQQQPRSFVQPQWSNSKW